MVRIITGDQNSGKSSRFWEMYSKSNKPTGLFSKKLYDETGQIAGYNLQLLPKGEELPFIVRKEQVEDEGKESYYYQGRFAFVKSVFERGTQYIKDNFEGNSVWIDEIGGLEIRGFGFAGLLRYLLEQEVDLLVVVRSSLVEEFLSAFNITKYEIVD